MAKKKAPPARVEISNSFADAAAAEQRGTRILWRSQPGPQTEALLRKEFEIFMGGAKFGGKSYLGIGWLMAGNPEVPWEKATPIDVSYLNCPQYRALAIRRNLIDLESWVDEARLVYEPMGAEYKQNPDEFVFPSGAKIILGHLDTHDAAYKYFGQRIQRAFVDELTFIPDFKTYQLLMSCVRSTIPGVRAQMLLTGNPGGPGHSWVESRFINPLDEHGIPIPPQTPIIEESFNPFLKQKVQITRIFIPAKISDNKIGIEQDPLYYNRLAGMDEAEKKAYLYGDWSAFKGEYFKSFRPVHRGEEPTNACHVVSLQQRKLEPWWPRWIGMDWGYKHNSAAFWACQDPNGQIIIYRELVSPEVSAVEFGMAIAVASRDDIRGLEKKNMILHLGPDAWQQRDEPNTIAELITSGIQRMYGYSAAYIIEDDGMAPSQTGEVSIGVVKAPHARIMGWQYIRELMRWKTPDLPPGTITKTREILPKLLISDTCTRLIKAIPSASYAKDGEDVFKTDSPEDDILDGFRYLLAAHKFMQNTEPYQVFYARRMEAAEALHPEGMDGMMQFFVAQKIQQDFKGKDHNTPMMVNRSSSRRARFNRQEWATQRGISVQ